MGIINFFQGFIPTAGQWQSFFDGKQDALGNPGANNFLIGNGNQWQPQTLANVQTLLGIGRLKIAQTVDFNAGNADTAFQIPLPSGFTRYVVDSVRISGASHTLVTATAGLFTAAAAGGVAIVTAASAITVSATADATVNNAMSFTVNGQNTTSYTAATLYFRVATAEGAAATASVTITVSPLP
jgi:hypothetical protein